MTTVISFTSLVGYRFYNQPQLSPDKISSLTIVAPYDGSFTDLTTTEENRKKIINGVIPVLKIDELTTIAINNKIDLFFQNIEDYRKLFEQFNKINPYFLKPEILEQILKSEAWELDAIIHNNNRLTKPTLDQVRLDIAKYRQQIPAVNYAHFQETIVLLRQKYQKILTKYKNINVSLDRLIYLNDKQWNILKYITRETAEKILTQGLPAGLPNAIKERAIERQLETINDGEIQTVCYNVLLGFLESNLIIDETATKVRAARFVEEMEPVIISIKKGEVIVNAGEKITQEDFVLLDGFKLSQREINWLGLGFSAFLVMSAVMIFILVARREHKALRRRDLILVCLLSLSAPFLAIFNINYTSLPAVALLVSTFYRPNLAVTQTILLSGLVCFATNGRNWEYLFAGTVGGIIAAAIGGKLHSREDLAFLGATIGLVQGAVYVIINLLISASAKVIWSLVLPGGIVYGLSGIAWVVLALGISPYLERLFDLVTPIRLAELSNPNRPLLKKLALEAPGTFQHTMFVASLAEAAGRELHCNVELIRAGTLYHDIGKLHDPLGFIENQMGGPNKHDQINNPWESAAIIKKHVTEGLVMARHYGLPKAIRDFIPEHQGTLLISYFYFQARQIGQQEDQEVLPEDFQYDGPIPQSRETGIVMLADACEAALRTLKEATPSEAIITIQKIFKARWRDQQLADSGIKYEELPIIAEIFVRVWQQYNHQRIAYPKAVLN